MDQNDRAIPGSTVTASDEARRVSNLTLKDTSHAKVIVNGPRMSASPSIREWSLYGESTVTARNGLSSGRNVRLLSW